MIRKEKTKVQQKLISSLLLLHLDPLLPALLTQFAEGDGRQGVLGGKRVIL